MNTKQQVTVIDRLFTRSHAKAPRGFGSWCFATAAGSVDVASDAGEWEPNAACGGVTVGKQYVWVHAATFADARKVAKAMAAERGWGVLYVMP